MCFAPSPPKPPPPPAPPAKDADPNVLQARTDQQRRARASQGYGSTIATSPMGDTSSASTAGKVLLGS